MKSKFLVQSSLKDFDINLLIDRDKFYKEELNNRRRYKLAPFKRMTGLIVYGKNQKSIINSAARLVSELSYINNLQVFGPIPAPIQKISGMYRWRILLRYNRDFAIQNVLSSIKTKQNMKIKIDIDPISFY